MTVGNARAGNKTMTREHSRSADEVAIRGLIEAIAQAVRARDVDEMLANCAPDIATFDMVPPLRHQGADAIRRVWAGTLAALEPPVEYEVHDLDLSVGYVAFSRSLNRFAATKKDGERFVNWLCTTLGFRKIDGRWKVVHEHVSVPFDMETGKAMLDLKP